MNIKLKDMLGKAVKSGKIAPSIAKKIQKMKPTELSKQEGYIEGIECFLAGDFQCVLRNIDWAVAQLLVSTVTCSLGQTEVDPLDSGRIVSSGMCYNLWGIPFIGQSQKCANVPVNKPVNTCQSKCTESAASFESAGCDGVTAWCWCRTDT